MKEFTQIYVHDTYNFYLSVTRLLEGNWEITSSGYAIDSSDSDYNTYWAHFIREKKDEFI